MDRIYATNDSTVILDGYDFILGNGLSWSIDGETIIGVGLLSGKWFNGTSWTIDITGNNDNAIIKVVPEPATLILFCLGGLLLRKTRSN